MPRDCGDLVLPFPNDLEPVSSGSVGISFKLKVPKSLQQHVRVRLNGNDRLPESIIEENLVLVNKAASRNMHLRVLNLCLESERLVQDAKDKQMEATESIGNLEYAHLNKQSQNLHLQAECRSLQAEIRSAQAENKLKQVGLTHSKSIRSGSKLSNLEWTPVELNLQMDVTNLFLEAVRLKLMLEYTLKEIHVSALRSQVRQLRRLKRKAEYLKVQAQCKEFEADNRADEARSMFKRDAEDSSDLYSVEYAIVACWKTTAEILDTKRRDRQFGGDDRQLSDFLTDVTKLLQL